MPRAAVHDAVTEAVDGCLIAVDAKPGRQRTLFPADYDAWRHRIVAHLDASARDNKANHALVQAVAERLDVAAGRVRLAEGATHHLKRVHVLGVTKAEAVRRLAAALPEARP